MDKFTFGLILIIALASSFGRNDILFANGQFMTSNGSIDVKYVSNISNSIVHVYDYDFPSEQTSFVVSTSAITYDTVSQIFVYTNYPSYSESWTLPYNNPLFPQHMDQTQSRIFCQDFANPSTKSLNFSVRIQSFSPQPLEYSLKVYSMESNILETGKSASISVPACFPKYFIYQIPDDILDVEVQLASPSDLCSLVRITSYSCPPDFSLRSSKGVDGHELTMLRSANLKVKRSDFVEGRMMILLIPVPAAQCGTTLEFGQNEYEKNITITVKPGNSEFWNPILKMTLIFVIPYIMFVLIIGFEMILSCFFRQHCEDLSFTCHFKKINEDSNVKPKVKISEIKKSKESGDKTVNDELEIKDFKDVKGGNEPSEKNPQMKQSKVKGKPKSIMKSSSSIKKDEELFEAFRTGILKNDLSENVRIQYYNKILNDREANLSDVNVKKDRGFKRTGGMFTVLLLVVGFFYMLPAVQVSFINREQMRETGVQDICYINFGCDDIVGPFRAFNNIWSNISYILLSILFAIITLVKNRMYVSQVKAEGRPVAGIPQRFGLYYAMSLALFFEGVMSAIYHICPSLINYQFDTTFMYILLAMLGIRLYKMRHLDMEIDPEAVLLLISCAVFFTFASVFGEDPTHFYSRFFLTIILMILISLSIVLTHTFMVPELVWYWLNEWKENRATTSETLRIFFWPKYNRSRTYSIFLQIVNFVVIAAVLWAPGMLSTVGTAVLYFFALNILFAFTYYWAMKFKKREHHHRPWIFYISFFTLITSVICWVIALYFWSLTAIHWEVSPARAREFNTDCVFLDYYDYHDLWHVMSAYAIFTLYLSTLIIDENLNFQKREDIDVI